MSSFSRMLIIHPVGLDSETHFLPSWSRDRNSVGEGNSRGTGVTTQSRRWQQGGVLLEEGGQEQAALEHRAEGSDRGAVETSRGRMFRQTAL